MATGQSADECEDEIDYADLADFREETVVTRNWLFSGESDHGITTESLPGSLCSAPFIWEYLGHKYAMEFIAGFIGFTQNEEDFAVRPKIGWAVRER